MWTSIFAPKKCTNLDVTPTTSESTFTVPQIMLHGSMHLISPQQIETLRKSASLHPNRGVLYQNDIKSIAVLFIRNVIGIFAQWIVYKFAVKIIQTSRSHQRSRIKTEQYVSLKFNTILSVCNYLRLFKSA